MIQRKLKFMKKYLIAFAENFTSVGEAEYFDFSD